MPAYTLEAEGKLYPADLDKGAFAAATLAREDQRARLLPQHVAQLSQLL